MYINDLMYSPHISLVKNNFFLYVYVYSRDHGDMQGRRLGENTCAGPRRGGDVFPALAPLTSLISTINGNIEKQGKKLELCKHVKLIT